MLGCATAVIVGIQGVGLAVVARSYAAHLGLLPSSARIELALERLTLERGLIVGALLMIAGLAAFVVAVILWSSTGFGELNVIRTIRVPILGMVFVIAGLQLMMVSFTMSLTQLATPTTTPRQ